MTTAEPPRLDHGTEVIHGFVRIVRHLSTTSHPARDLDAHLDRKQRIDSVAYVRPHRRHGPESCPSH